MSENEQHEREKMALRLEVQLLRSGHQLPINPPRQELEED